MRRTDTVVLMSSVSRPRIWPKRRVLGTIAWIAAAPLGIIALNAGTGNAVFLPWGSVIVGALFFWPKRPA